MKPRLSKLAPNRFVIASRTLSCQALPAFLLLGAATAAADQSFGTLTECNAHTRPRLTESLLGQVAGRPFLNVASDKRRLRIDAQQQGVRRL